MQRLRIDDLTLVFNILAFNNDPPIFKKSFWVEKNKLTVNLSGREKGKTR